MTEPLIHTHIYHVYRINFLGPFYTHHPRLKWFNLSSVDLFSHILVLLVRRWCDIWTLCVHPTTHLTRVRRTLVCLHVTRASFSSSLGFVFMCVMCTCTRSSCLCFYFLLTTYVLGSCIYWFECLNECCNLNH